MIDEELIFKKIDAENFDQVVTILGKKMEELNYVKDSYVTAVIEREKNFPTGLAMGDYGIAIPHTDREHVNQSVLAIATLQAPIKIHSMINPDELIEVSLVILMAVEDPEGQVKMLSKLMKMFQDVENLKKLEAAQTVEKMYEIVSEMNLEQN